MKQQCLTFLMTVLMVLGVTNCASIVSKSEYPVAIHSQPDQADISIADENGEVVYAGKTPTTVTLSAREGYFSGKDYTVTFTKEGYATHVAHIERGVDAWYILGNIVFGGLIGWLIVDPATGAMWTLEDDVSATLSPQTASTQNKGGLTVISIEEVPESLRSKLVKVN